MKVNKIHLYNCGKRLSECGNEIIILVNDLYECGGYSFNSTGNNEIIEYPPYSINSTGNSELDNKFKNLTLNSDN